MPAQEVYKRQVHILADEFVGQISRVLYGNAVRKGGHAVKRDGLMLLHGIPHAGRARGLYTVHPVSYTHLEVYKRQTLNIPIPSNGGSTASSTAPITTAGV